MNYVGLGSKVIKLYDEGDRTILVMEYIEGETLQDFISEVTNLQIINNDLMLHWIKNLAQKLDILHKNGFVYRDLKPANIIIDSHNNVHLIDFESVVHIRDVGKQYFKGTDGYADPDCENNCPASISEDVYSFGKIVFSIYTFINLSFKPNNWDVIYNMFHFKKVIPQEIQKLIYMCINNKNNITDLYNLFTTVQDKSICTFPKHTFVNFHLLALSIGNTICADAKNNDEHVYWKTLHSTNFGNFNRELYLGTSGIALYLLGLYESTHNNKFLTYVKKAAKWLMDTTDDKSDYLPGLMLGEAGVGLFFLRLYTITKNMSYLHYAINRSNFINLKTIDSPDIFNGKAGIGLYNLYLYYVTHDEVFLNRSKNNAYELINNIIKNQNDVTWIIPDGYDVSSNKQFLGYAHGSAGIISFLFEINTIIHDDNIFQVAKNATKTLMNQSRTIGNVKNGLIWPNILYGTDYSIFWCHGSTGIGKFFLDIYEFTNEEIYLKYAKLAATAVIKYGLNQNSINCHGLSGSINLLMDIYQVTGNKYYHNNAKKIGHMLESHKVLKNFHYRWPSENPSIFTPDLMVGYSGVGDSISRLAYPNKYNIFSRKNFMGKDMH